MADDTAIVY